MTNRVLKERRIECDTWAVERCWPRRGWGGTREINLCVVRKERKLKKKNRKNIYIYIMIIEREKKKRSKEKGKEKYRI